MLNAVLVVVSALALVACAAPASHQAMALAPADISTRPNEKLMGQVYVRNVTGEKETNPLWTPQVDSQSFKTALEHSLSAIGYRSASPSARVKVDADLQHLQQPIIGASMTVNSTVGYYVVTDQGGKNIPVSAAGTAGALEALIGAERLKMANERSMKENIKLFISRLTQQFGP